MLKPGKDAGERESRRNKKAILLVTKVDVTRLRVTSPRDRRTAAVRSDPFVPPLGAIDLIADEVALRAPGLAFQLTQTGRRQCPRNRSSRSLNSCESLRKRMSNKREQLTVNSWMPWHRLYAHGPP